MYLIVVLFVLVCVRVCVEVASLYECCLFSVEIILSLVIAIFSFVIVGNVFYVIYNNDLNQCHQHCV